MEAAVRIELTNTGFADPRLTTWLRRHEIPRGAPAVPGRPEPAPRDESWSGKRDSNPRPRPWQGRALPLSYSRLTVNEHRDSNTALGARPPQPATSRSAVAASSGGTGLMKKPLPHSNPATRVSLGMTSRCQWK